MPASIQLEDLSHETSPPADQKNKMKKSVIAVLIFLVFASQASHATDGVIEDGKWTMLEEPMQVGNMGLLFDASVKAEDYESGPIRDITFQCEYGKPQLTIRVIGENLSMNNGAVVYSIDNGPNGIWDMKTKFKSGVFLQSTDETAASSIRELLGHEKLAVSLKLVDNRTKVLEFNIAGIKDRIRNVLLLCKI